MELHRISSEKELLNAFRIRDRKKVEVPKRANFPMSFEYYLTWSDCHDNYRYLVINRPNHGLAGIVFEFSQPSSAPGTNRLCEWCHSYGSSDRIDLLTVANSARKVSGILLCTDLGCIQRIEVAGRISRRSYEELASELCERIRRFYSKNLE